MGNNREALIIVWAMVTTHRWWLEPDSVIDVPYDAIDQALKFTSGTTKNIWALARSLPAVAATGALFESTYLTNTPPNPPWNGKACLSIGDYLNIYDSSIDTLQIPDITVRTTAAQ